MDEYFWLEQRGKGKKGITTPPSAPFRLFSSALCGWAAFRIPNSEFRIQDEES
jgi:hypothetical protein